MYKKRDFKKQHRKWLLYWDIVFGLKKIEKEEDKEIYEECDFKLKTETYVSMRD